MPDAAEKLAVSLEALHELQKGGRRVFQSRELSRVNRERLLKHGFLSQVIRGWLISSSPNTLPGDTTPWYASFWDFCAAYCRSRFGEDWHLSAEQSILLHAAATAIPGQVVVYSPGGTNNTTELLFGTSIYDLKANLPGAEDLMECNGLRLFIPVAALIKVPEDFFRRYPVEAQVVLANVRDASDVLGRLLDGGHSAIAGRLAGAFRRIGRGDIAEEIIATMRAADYDARESDPFAPEQTLGRIQPQVAPIVVRLEATWQGMRGAVIETMPRAPGLPVDREAYLRFVDEIYESDAYHSLSIEGYHVTPELIARVRSGSWDPQRHEEDGRNRDALAARGYWQAFQSVKQGVAQVLSGENPGSLALTAHREWYRELFQPSVAGGLIPASALAGYRNDAVYLRGSRHVPPRWEAVRDAMPALFDLLEGEDVPAVRAVLGHWLVGYVHPYPDGNGRIARFLMNVMLASGGYPWTVIRVEDRAAYLAALESASVDGDIRPFSRFIAQRVAWSMDQARTD